MYNSFKKVVIGVYLASQVITPFTYAAPIPVTNGGTLGSGSVVDFNSYPVGNYGTSQHGADFGTNATSRGLNGFPFIGGDNTAVVDIAGNKAVQVKYPTNSFGSSLPPGGASWQIPFVSPTKHAKFSFDATFVSGFDFGGIGDYAGGKMHGIKTANCNGDSVCPNGLNIRMMRRPLATHNGNDTRLVAYTYRPEKPSSITYGYDFPFLVGAPTMTVQPNGDVTLPNGSIYTHTYGAIDSVNGYPVIRMNDNQKRNMAIESQVNSVAGARDGYIKMYMDGVLVLNVQGIELGDTSLAQNQFSHALFQTFHGGGDNQWAPNTDSYANFDNFKLENNYTVPVVTTPATPHISTTVRVDRDGLPIFDSTTFDPITLTNPGTDTNANNGVVRVQDSMLYRVEVAVNDADANNVTATVTLDNGTPIYMASGAVYRQKRTKIPDSCLPNLTSPNPVGPTSEIKDNGQTLICNLGNHHEGSNLFFYAVAQVSNLNLNGDLIDAKVSTVADGALPAISVSTKTVTTAKYAVDITKNLDGSMVGTPQVFVATKGRERDPANATAGVYGDVYSYTINVGYQIGSEMTTGTNYKTNLQIVDTFSQASNIGNAYPYKIYSVEYINVDTGSYTTLGTGKYLFSLTGAKTFGSTSIAQIKVKYWIPSCNTSAPLLGQGRNGSGFTFANSAYLWDGTTGISWNRVSATNVVPTSESLSNNVSRSWGSSDSSCDTAVGVSPVFTTTHFYGGLGGYDGSNRYENRLVTRNENVDFTMGLLRGYPTYKQRQCAILDTANMEFDRPSDDIYSTWIYNESGGPNYDLHGGSQYYIFNYLISPQVGKYTNGDMMIIYYTDSVVGNSPACSTFSGREKEICNMTKTSCDASNNRVTDPNTLPGGKASVTKIKIEGQKDFTQIFTGSTPYTAGYARTLTEFYGKVKSGSVVGQKIPVINLHSTDNGVTWVNQFGIPSNNLDAWPHDGARRGGDYITVIAANVGIAKSTIPANLSIVDPGQVITYSLTPSINGSYIGDAALTLTDTRPSDMLYVPGSISLTGCGAGQHVAATVGATTMTFSITGVDVGEPVCQIVYKLKVSDTAAAGNKINTVKIASANPDLNYGQCSIARNTGAVTYGPSDCAGTFVPYSAVEFVIVPSSVGVFDVVKSVDQNVFPKDGAFSMKLGYKNKSNENIGVGAFIDILPYNGDTVGAIKQSGISATRDPATSYTGIYTLTSVAGNPGEVYYYTSKNPADIHPDVCHASNAVAGVLPTFCSTANNIPTTTVSPTIWCTVAQFNTAGCPTNITKSTAVRFDSIALPAGTARKFVTLNFATNGNKAGDIYTNAFGGRIPNIGLPIISNDVTISVIAGSIGNTVWLDTNGDGIQSGAGESGIPNAVVQLYSGTTLLSSTTTDIFGQYAFTGLGLGNYIVKVLNIGQYIPTYDKDGGNDLTTIVSILPINFTNSTVLEKLSTVIDIDFGVNLVPLGSLGGTIYNDLTANGKDSSDMNLSGTVVTLTSNGITMTGVTNASGAYMFTGLLPATYTLSYISTNPNLSAFASTVGNQGMDIVGSAPSLTTLQVPLATGANGTNFDFGLVSKSSISGTIAVDQNNNSLVDGNPTDYGVANVTVELLSGGVIIATGTTNNLGQYSFTGLVQGIYTVRYMNASSYIPFGSIPGMMSGAVVGSVVSYTEIGNITLPWNTTGSTYDFYLNNPSNIIINKTIDGGTGANSYPGAPHIWTINVSNNGSGTAFAVRVQDVVDTAFVVSGWTATTGVYTGNIWTIGDIPANTSVQLLIYGSIDSGFVGTIVNTGTITGFSGTNTNANNVHSAATLTSIGSALTGSLYYDSDGNKTKDSMDMNLSGVTVYLYNAVGVVIKSTLTDEYGNYTFANLVPNIYTLKTDVPAGYQSRVANPSGTNGTASDALTLSTITLGANQTIQANNFGMIKFAQVQGNIYHDKDIDAIFDSAEGMSGIIVTLMNGTHTYTTTTKSDGSYTFTGVVPGMGYTTSYSYAGNLIPMNGTSLTAYTLLPEQNKVNTNFYLRTPFDLEITKTVTHPDPNNTDTVVYTIQYGNTGGTNASAVTIKDYWPAHILLGTCDPVATSPFTYSTGGSDYTGYLFTLGTIAPGMVGTITCTGRVDTGYTLGTTIENLADILSSEPELNTGNNNSATNTTFDAVDIETTMTVSPAILAVDETAIYTVTFTNNGTNSSYTTFGEVTLPSQVDYVSDDAAGVVAGQQITFDLGTLAVGESKTFTITTKTNATGVVGSTYTTTSKITTSSFETNIINNTATATIAIIPQQGMLHGKVILDQDRNGTSDGTNTISSGVTVIIKNAAGSVVATLLTNSDGNYSWTGDVGAYSTEVLPPAGYWLTTPSVAIVSIGHRTTTDVATQGLHAYSTLGGYIFDDILKNGLSGYNAPLADVPVVVKNANGEVIWSGVTNSSGMWTSNPLWAGEIYTVEVSTFGKYTFITTTNPDTITALPGLNILGDDGLWYERAKASGGGSSSAPIQVLPTPSFSSAPVIAPTLVPTVQEPIQTAPLGALAQELPAPIKKVIIKEDTSLFLDESLDENNENNGEGGFKLPSFLPKTGGSSDVFVLYMLFILLGLGAYISRKKFLLK